VQNATVSPLVLGMNTLEFLGVKITDVPSTSVSSYCSLAYSALACFSIGMSGSASFQRMRNSW